MNLAECLTVSVLAFVSTNLDDVLVLLAFLADPKVRKWHVLLGQYLGLAVLTGGSWLLAMFALHLPVLAVRGLGLLPIALGLRGLWKLRHPDDDEDAPSGLQGLLTVAMVTVANGGDNVAVYVPLIGKLGHAGILVLAAVFALMTAIWFGLALWLLSHRSVLKAVDKWGHIVTPLVLIAIGVYVLVGT